MAKRNEKNSFATRLRNFIKRALGVNDPELHKLFLTGHSRSSTQVTEDAALSISGVFRCLTLLGESMSRTKKVIERKTSNGWVLDEQNSLNDLLSFPSKAYTAFNFYMTMAAFLKLYGNAYALIKRDAAYRPVELIIVHPSDVEPIIFIDDFYYKVTLYGVKQLVVDPADIIHLAGFLFDRPHTYGKPLLRIHNDTYSLSKNSRDYSIEFYENGAHLDGYLHTEAHLNTREIDEITEKFDYKTKGLAAVGTTPVLHSGLKYVPVKLTPRDALFLEVGNMTLGDISRIFGIPLHLLSDLSRSTFSNIEQQAFEYLANAIEPLAALITDAFNMKLVPVTKRRTLRVRFDTTPLTAGDSRAKSDRYLKLFQTGAMSSNDIRVAEGMNPRENGDQYFTPVNLYTDEEREQRLENQRLEQERLVNEAMQSDPLNDPPALGEQATDENLVDTNLNESNNGTTS